MPRFSPLVPVLHKVISASPGTKREVLGLSLEGDGNILLKFFVFVSFSVHTILSPIL